MLATQLAADQAGIVMYRKALLDDPDDIIENVEDALTHLR